MLNALIICFREGFEAFLSVAIIFAFLRKTGRDWLRPAVYWGIAASIVASAGLGWLLQNVNQALWEGVLALVAAVLVITFVIHVWRTAPRMKQEMETKLEEHSTKSSRTLAALGVFGFTLLMITREGMETVLLLIQVREQANFVIGAILGVLAAATLSWVWAHFGHRVNIKRFFQVTGFFLLVFAVQIVFYAIHEFAEAELLPNWQAIHDATEPYTPVGYYGKWFSVALVGICALYLIGVSIFDRMRQQRMALETQ